MTIEREAAKPKRPRDLEFEDAPSQESIRGLSPRTIKRNPSADQKRVRREMQRKTASQESPLADALIKAAADDAFSNWSCATPGCEKYDGMSAFRGDKYCKSCMKAGEPDKQRDADQAKKRSSKTASKCETCGNSNFTEGGSCTRCGRSKTAALQVEGKGIAGLEGGDEVRYSHPDHPDYEFKVTYHPREAIGDNGQPARGYVKGGFEVTYPNGKTKYHDHGPFRPGKDMNSKSMVAQSIESDIIGKIHRNHLQSKRYGDSREAAKTATLPLPLDVPSNPREPELGDHKCQQCDYSGAPVLSQAGAYSCRNCGSYAINKVKKQKTAANPWDKPGHFCSKHSPSYTRVAEPTSDSPCETCGGVGWKGEGGKTAGAAGTYAGPSPTGGLHHWMSVDSGDDEHDSEDQCLGCGVVAPDVADKDSAFSDHGALPMSCPGPDGAYNAHHFTHMGDGELDCAYCGHQVKNDTKPSDVHWECLSHDRGPIPQSHPNAAKYPEHADYPGKPLKGLDYHGSKIATQFDTQADRLNPGDQIRTPTGQTVKVLRMRNHETSGNHVYMDTDQGTSVVRRKSPVSIVPHNSQQQEMPGYGTPGGNTNQLPMDRGNVGPSNQTPGGSNAAPSTDCPVCGGKGTLHRKGQQYVCSKCGYRENFGAAGPGEGYNFTDMTQQLRGKSSLSAIARRAQEVLETTEEIQ